MTVDREILAARVAKIRTELGHLARLERVTREEFVASTLQQHAVERELQLVVEACLDIGHHVISRQGLKRPQDYRDVFRILRGAGIIENDLGRRLEDMAGFRNRIVHGYLELDPGQVYEIARSRLADVEAFVAAIVGRFLPDAADC